MSKRLIHDEGFKGWHRQAEKYFSREWLLTLTLFRKNAPALTKLQLLPRHRHTAARDNQVEAQAPATTTAPGPNGAEADGTNSLVTHAMVAKPNGQGQVETRKGRSRSLAAKAASWEVVCVNIPTLTDDEQGQLAQLGWTAAEVIRAAGSITTLRQTDNVQQLSTQNYKAMASLARRDEAALREWYNLAEQLIGLAIERRDPENRQQLITALGF